MERRHQYQSTVTWTGNRGSGTLDYRAYDRNFLVRIEGKPDIEGSSDSVFNGDKSVHNPEDMLLSAVASCHMLWYLHLCSENEIIVLEYTDYAIGEMKEEKDGSGRFESITLQPEIVINDEKNIVKAKALHAEANKMCFIANSLNFPVKHEVKVSILV